MTNPLDFKSLWQMDDWLVSVEKGSKVVELYYSKKLVELGTIRAIHKGCDVIVERLDTGLSEHKKVEEKKESVKCVTRKVKCLESGEIFASVTECSNAINVSRWNVYKAIQRGTVLNKRHYDYID